jgi:hypothetical protein
VGDARRPGRPFRIIGCRIQKTDGLRGHLRIGLHREVTDLAATTADAPAPLVSQAFCSSLPVAY